MAVTVELVRNVLTNLYLTNALSIIAFHHTMYDPNNFHLYDNGPVRHLQEFSNSDMKFLHVPTNTCNQTFSTDSIGSDIYATPSNASIGVKLYVKDSSDSKYFLRVNTLEDFKVELVCQYYADEVSYHPYFRQELEFDLIAVDIEDLKSAPLPTMDKQ